MKIFISVKSNAKTEKIEKINETNFKIWVKETPTEGKANRAVIKALADYFNIAPARVSVISGHQSKKKIVEIL